MRSLRIPLLLLFLNLVASNANASENLTPKINDLNYFEAHGLNIMFFDDYYPEGHQGGISIIQHGKRTATNGDLRIGIDPGQWQPIPKKGERTVDMENGQMSVSMSFPDKSKHLQGFNPMIYPDLDIQYKVSVQAIDSGIEVTVDLEEAVPEKWLGEVGFNIEFFPGMLFGKSFQMDDSFGYFPQQANGPMFSDKNGAFQIEPMAKGRKITIAPEADQQRITISSETELELIDGRGSHNNGWFILRSPIQKGKTRNAVVWKIQANIDPNWAPSLTLQVSQIGYHPDQEKVAYIEAPKTLQYFENAALERFSTSGKWETVKEKQPDDWGKFLRYRYGSFDFSDVQMPGLYRVRYGAQQTHVFRIENAIYSRHVWQPTIEYFLPIQMCHMRVNEKYRVWHDTCHMDDALMAPTSINHFDGYKQGDETLTAFKPLQHVPGLNSGGWHDAGDYDLRIESQIGTTYKLALAYEEFQPELDQTLVDQNEKWVEIHHPDEKNDFLQQIEHGLTTVLGGYDSLGRLYRGIITPTLRQYVLLGDAASMSDGKPYVRHPEDKVDYEGVWYQHVANKQSKNYDPHRMESAYKSVIDGLDDRLVFTEENPQRSLMTAAGLACAARVMHDYDNELSSRSLQTAEALWKTYANSTETKAATAKIHAAVELALTTSNLVYIEFLLAHRTVITENFEQVGYSVGRILHLIEDETFINDINTAAVELKGLIIAKQNETPYGVPYEPNIWGDGWSIQRFGMTQYFLHKTWPDLFPMENLLKALNFILGCHPGENTASFVSGVGSHSVLSAYGINRADRSFIPGGSVSGTALIRPDFPELLDWPYLWQQTEYVMGGGATNFMFLAMAADHLLTKSK